MTDSCDRELRLKLVCLCLVSLMALSLAGGCRKGPPQPASPSAPITTPEPSGGPLLVYCGNSMRPPMEELSHLYQKETGTKIEITINDSGTLLLMIDESRKGDLYVCHDPFGGAAEVKGLARKTRTVAYLVPLIAVAKGNPKSIHSLKDLVRPEIKLGLTHKQYSTAGHIGTFMFEKAGIFDQVDEKAIRTRTGGELGNALKLGHVDAAIIWDAVAYRYRDLVETIPLDQEYRPRLGVDAVTTATFGKIELAEVKVFVQTLTCSTQPELTEEFAEFVASARGKEVFKKYGFTVK